MSLIRNCIPDPGGNNLETHLSLANEKRLKVNPEINKLKVIKDGSSLQLQNFSVLYLEIRRSGPPEHDTVVGSFHLPQFDCQRNLDRKCATSMSYF